MKMDASRSKAFRKQCYVDYKYSSQSVWHNMTFGQLSETLQQELKSKFRKIENIRKKIIKGEWSFKFNFV